MKFKAVLLVISHIGAGVGSFNTHAFGDKGSQPNYTGGFYTRQAMLTLVNLKDPIDFEEFKFKIC